jgi:hypothetical protein
MWWFDQEYIIYSVTRAYHPYSYICVSDGMDISLLHTGAIVEGAESVKCIPTMGYLYRYYR